MITTSNSSYMKRSRTPNQLLDVRRHTIACSGLSCEPNLFSAVHVQYRVMAEQTVNAALKLLALYFRHTCQADVTRVL